MDLAWLQPAVKGPGPFVSAHLDVTRDTRDAAHEIDLRWQAVRRQLEEQGAPGELVEHVGARMLSQTVPPGEAGHSVVAGPEGVLVDRVTMRRPRRDSGHYGQVPHLMPLLRGMGEAIGYAVVEVDRAGADVTVVEPDSRSGDKHEVEGGGRPEGKDEKVFQQRIDELLTQRLQVRMGEVLARYDEAKGTDTSVASGLGAVVAAARGGSVQTLLLHDDPSSDLTLWAGEEPLQVGSSREEVEALGARHPVEDRADDVLLRALVAQDAAIELVEVGNVLPGGIAALLRFDVRPPVPGSGA
jgi:hypothetical protein